MHPRLACVTSEAGEQIFKDRYNRLEILFSKIGPFVVVNGLLNRPLLDVRCAAAEDSVVFRLATASFSVWFFHD